MKKLFIVFFATLVSHVVVAQESFQITTADQVCKIIKQFQNNNICNCGSGQKVQYVTKIYGDKRFRIKVNYIQISEDCHVAFQMYVEKYTKGFRKHKLLFIHEYNDRNEKICTYIVDQTGKLITVDEDRFTGLYWSYGKDIWGKSKTLPESYFTRAKEVFANLQ